MKDDNFVDVNLNAKNLIELVGEIFRTQPVEELDYYKFEMSHFVEDLSLTILHSRVEELLDAVRSKSIHQNTIIYDERTYEVLVSVERRPIELIRSTEGFNKVDEENRIAYTLGRPSYEYLVFLLDRLSQIAPIRYSFDPGVSARTLLRRIEREEYDDPFDLLRYLFPRYISLTIKSETRISLEQFTKYADAYLFQIAYNLDIPLIVQQSLEELIRTRRITHLRRNRPEDIEAPKRFYTADLIHHYLMAVASDSAPLQFLSYFHVLEHFFESVFTDDLIEKVKDRITQPDFSYKQKRDIKKLIDEIARLVKYRDEQLTVNEPEALRLTIQKYIDIDILVHELNQYDASLLDYYSTTVVEFSNGDTVDFGNADRTKVIGQLARRIYRTRNSIVHSKDNDKSRYTPFVHDSILTKEIPLMRFIAEITIKTTSRIP